MDAPDPCSQRSLQPCWQAFSCGGGRACGLALLCPHSFWGYPEGSFQRPLAPENHLQQCVLGRAAPLLPPPARGMTKAGTHPPCRPHGSHHQSCSLPSCEWKSTQGVERAAPPSGSQFPRHRIHTASQELFSHSRLPGALLKGRLVWPCLPSGHWLQPAALPLHAAPSKHPHQAGRAKPGCRVGATPATPAMSPSVRCHPAVSSHPQVPVPPQQRGTISYIQQWDGHIFSMSTVGSIFSCLDLSHHSQHSSEALQSAAPFSHLILDKHKPSSFALGIKHPWPGKANTASPGWLQKKQGCFPKHHATSGEDPVNFPRMEEAFEGTC